jgi:hypothetical protein
MTKVKLLSTVAASLLLGASMASAQMKEQGPPERAPATQQKAPAEKVAPAMNAGQPKGPETTGQGASKELTPGSNDNVKPGGAMNAPSGKDSTGMKGDSRTGADIKAKSDANSAPNKAAADKTAPDKSAQDKAGTAPSTAQGSQTKSSTTGQGAAGAAKLSTEQRTKVTTAFKQQKVARVEPAKLNVSISIGTRVPSTVRFYPVPRDVVVIYPEWRGYDYIIVGDKIVVLEPGSHAIVAILDA